MMRIVVTGSEGFIGKHVVARLGEHDVVRIDRKLGTDIAFHNAAQYSLASSVIHLAAHADVRSNWDHLEDIELDNINATLSCLEVSREAGTVRTFVFVSTGAVYANHAGDVTEDTPCVATSPYAASKLAGEAYVQAYAEKCGWRWYVLRPAACFGKGYTHGHVADFVNMARGDGIRAVSNGMEPRPAIHVEDLADTLAALATGDYPSGIYNATGGTWTWRRTALMMGVNGQSSERSSGWIGDSKGATWGHDKLSSIGLGPKRKVEDGVRDALRGLGWQS